MAKDGHSPVRARTKIEFEQFAKIVSFATMRKPPMLINNLNISSSECVCTQAAGASFSRLPNIMCDSRGGFKKLDIPSHPFVPVLTGNSCAALSSPVNGRLSFCVGFLM